MKPLRWLILVLFWGCLFIATHLPRLPRVVHRVSDKVSHFAAYALLGALVMWATSSSTRPVWQRALLVWGAILVYAALDELLQIPVGRVCDLQDWLADALGSGLAIGLATLGTLAYRAYRPGTPQPPVTYAEFKPQVKRFDERQ